MAILMGAAIWKAATHTPLLLEFLLLSSAGHVTLFYTLLVKPAVLPLLRLGLLSISTLSSAVNQVVAPLPQAC